MKIRRVAHQSAKYVLSYSFLNATIYKGDTRSGKFKRYFQRHLKMFCKKNHVYSDEIVAYVKPVNVTPVDKAERLYTVEYLTDEWYTVSWSNTLDTVISYVEGKNPWQYRIFHRGKLICSAAKNGPLPSATLVRKYHP